MITIHVSSECGWRDILWGFYVGWKKWWTKVVKCSEKLKHRSKVQFVVKESDAVNLSAVRDDSALHDELQESAGTVCKTKHNNILWYHTRQITIDRPTGGLLSHCCWRFISAGWESVFLTSSLWHIPCERPRDRTAADILHWIVSKLRVCGSRSTLHINCWLQVSRYNSGLTLQHGSRSVSVRYYA